MASGGNNEDDPDQVVPEDSRADIRSIQSHYLRSPPPSRLPATSETDTESIFEEPIHLSSAVAAKKIIREELKPRAVKVRPVPESMHESARQLMVEDLYNRVKEMTDNSSSYNTPCLLDIQRAILQDRLEAPLNPVDEVWPSIFIAERTVAVNKSRLRRMGITHVLNAAHATGVYTSKDFYKDMNIRYHGVEVDDFPFVDISPHFRKAAEFLDEALLTHKGLVLVNSVMGISRSAVLVAAYLMIFHHMTIMEALLALRKKRPICPNEGFLKQLRQLNETLLQERDGNEHNSTLSQGSATEEEEQSILGAEAHSIFVEEEDYSESKISSTASVTQRSALTEHNQQSEDEVPNLPNEPKLDVDNECIVHEQQMKERYQRKDLESVRCVDVQVLKEEVWGKEMSYQLQGNSASALESSYTDMGKQQLRQTEQETAKQYRSRNRGEGDMTRAECRQEDEESALSESRPRNRSYPNEETLSPLEKWRARRIQFGWNEEDTDTRKKTRTTDGEENVEGEEKIEKEEEEDIKVLGLEDVDLTTNLAWKRKRQKRRGGNNKDEIVELNRDEHREDILERYPQNLEESQSTSGRDTENLPSAGSVPLCTGWSNLSNRSTSENATSLLSMQSGCSSFTQICSELYQLAPPIIPSHTTSQIPTEPPALVQNKQMPEVVNSTSVQNWISNVVTETVFQKLDQGMMMEGNTTTNKTNSALSLSMLSCGERTRDEGKTLKQSEASCSSPLSQRRPGSVISATYICQGKGAYKGQITDMSKPHYSIFQDQVKLHKLDAMDREMKFEMRGKMITNEMQKIATDKHTPSFRKKPKEESDEDDEDYSEGMSKTASKYNPTFDSERLDTPSDLTGRCSSSVIDRHYISSNKGWWRGDTKTHSTHPECLKAKGTKPLNSSFREQVRENSLARNPQELEKISRSYRRAARELSASNQLQTGGTSVECHLDPCAERPHHSRLPAVEDFSAYSQTESKYRMRRSNTTDVEKQEEKEELQDFTVKRQFRYCSGYEESTTEVNQRRQVDRKNEEDGPASISQHRLRSLTKAEEDQC